MQAFIEHTGLVAPLDRANVDTDAIIPKQFLTSIKRTGFGQNLFDEWRYADRGEPGMDCTSRPRRPDFVLNLPRYQETSILLTRANFGCGSSREHAAWALLQFGFRVVIAPSFGDIFFQNALKNGLLLVVLPVAAIDTLFTHAEQGAEALRLVVDLPKQRVHVAGQSVEIGAFEIDPFRKDCLLQGFDDVAITLGKTPDIQAFEARHHARFPWLASAGSA
ncbi:3-isopropylmalate dehydratase small subunit [Variovorax sp. Sphag1AA]|uniref:3-isopropylmalate dehydratase small subunit n=1 Tax=Variovorax sp. Sphag1AA TaxID=2587027 RepID=UPI001608CF93|nr:3-isopropylmalate dehydratase small subunit [Variovorax sp. Sphag1AA]MBB3182006.1 3-isopropylmalate/(R)-2-methylmalate dehydratase small subunit [Variovorax sp. Sphag1AA]